MKNEAPAQTLQEFMSPSRSHSVWKIILGFLLSVFVIGAVYFGTLPKEEPVRLDASLSGGTYAYLDIQLLSEWIYSVSGDDDYTLYAAVDQEDNWYIVALRDSIADSLSAQVAAFQYLYYYNANEAPIPDPVRVYGVTKSLSADDTDMLTEYFDLTTADIADYFGGIYLNEGATPENTPMLLCIFGAFFSGMILFTLVLIDWKISRNLKKSENRLYTEGLWDDALLQSSDPNAIRFQKSKLILGDRFVYSGASGYVLPYEDIAWVYQRKTRSYGIAVATILIAGLNNGTSVNLAIRHVNDDLTGVAADTIFAKNPSCLIGYSFHNMKQYRLLVQAYQQEHSNKK